MRSCFLLDPNGQTWIYRLVWGQTEVWFRRNRDYAPLGLTRVKQVNIHFDQDHMCFCYHGKLCLIFHCFVIIRSFEVVIQARHVTVIMISLVCALLLWGPARYTRLIVSRVHKWKSFVTAKQIFLKFASQWLLITEHRPDIFFTNIWGNNKAGGHCRILINNNKEGGCDVA